jgi:hypothetical protein
MVVSVVPTVAQAPLLGLMNTTASVSLTTIPGTQIISPNTIVRANMPLPILTSPKQMITTKSIVTSPTAPIRLNLPSGSINTSQVSGQLITLPAHITTKLNLQKPLNLKLNGQNYNIPPNCFISTADGVKVLLPPGSLPENTAKAGSASPLAMNASTNVSSQHLDVRQMNGMSPSDKSKVVDLTDDVLDKNKDKDDEIKSVKDKNIKVKDVSKYWCHINQLYAGYNSLLNIFQYLGTVDLLK